jgi:hypothetical protein
MRAMIAKLILHLGGAALALSLCACALTACGVNFAGPVESIMGELIGGGAYDGEPPAGTEADTEAEQLSQEETESPAVEDEERKDSPVPPDV